MSIKYLILFIFLISYSTISLAAIHIAQNAQGSNDGSSCANAHAVSWFNTASNWGTGTNQIGPGATVFLCGTITSHLTFQGNGTTNNYITIDGTGATLSATVYENDRSWWKVQNMTWVNGYGRALISMSGGSNGVFTGNRADEFDGGGVPAVWIGQGQALPNNITVSNNHIRTAATDFGNVQHDIIQTEGSTNVTIEGNYLEMRAGGTEHDDIIQTWEKGGSSSGAPRNWTIRYNKIVMNSSASNDRSWTMIEALGGNNYIYSNVFLGLHGAGGANGIDLRGPGSFYIYCNTIVAKPNASNNTFHLGTSGPAYIRNNIIHTSDQTAMLIYGSGQVIRDHNLWYGSRIPSCSGITGEICNQDPQFTDYANNDFSLRSGSPAIDAGANLGTPYGKYIVPGSNWPNPTLGQRPSSGNWTLSAYQLNNSGSALIAAPTNLRVQ